MQNTHIPEDNHLFGAMTGQARTRLQPLLELVQLEKDAILYKDNGSMSYFYFPINTIVALTYSFKSGDSSEVSIIGKEGLVGILSLLSSENSCARASVISPGLSYRIARKNMQLEFNQHSTTMLLFLRYIQSLVAQLALTAACNRHHSIEQQYCRLLLLLLDRLPCNKVSMTQESMSLLLGVRREGITEAAGKLQKLGAIDYNRGQLTVLNRTIVEKLSCECYSVVKNEMHRLIPQPIPIPPKPEFSHCFSNAILQPACEKCSNLDSCVYLKKNIKRITKKCI